MAVPVPEFTAAIPASVSGNRETVTAWRVSGVAAGTAAWLIGENGKREVKPGANSMNIKLPVTGRSDVTVAEPLLKGSG